MDNVKGWQTWRWGSGRWGTETPEIAGGSPLRADETRRRVEVEYLVFCGVA